MGQGRNSDGVSILVRGVARNGDAQFLSLDYYNQAKVANMATAAAAMTTKVPQTKR